MSVYDFDYYFQKRKAGEFPPTGRYRWRDEVKQSRGKSSSPPVNKLEVGEYYINPGIGVCIHVIEMTSESKVYQEQPIYIIEASDSVGDFWAMYADDERVNEWHLCTVEVFMHSLHQNTPPEVS